MADQQNRGGKKVGQAGEPGHSQQHEGAKPPGQDRPGAGQPGGPKQHAGETRSDKNAK